MQKNHNTPYIIGIVIIVAVVAMFSFFVYSDGIRNDNDARYRLDLEYWDTLSLKNGVSEEDLQKIHEHWASSDFYPKISDVLTWLKEAGFTNIDIVYKYCIWGVIHSQKP